LRPADILFVDHKSHPGCPRSRPSQHRRPHKGSLCLMPAVVEPLATLPWCGRQL